MTKKLPHTSKHKVGDSVAKIPRIFAPDHIAAGYREQTMGEHSTPDHDLLGTHDTSAGPVVVEHVEGVPKYEPREADGALVLVSGSPTVGPEFKLTWPDGASVTVPCADAVRGYLELAS